MNDEQNELHNRAMHVSGVYKDYQKMNIQDKKVNIETENMNIQDEKVNFQYKNVNIDVEQIYAEEMKGYTSRTAEYNQKMFSEFGIEIVFVKNRMKYE